MTGWLFDTLITTSILMLFVLLIRKPVARMFGPAIAYALWAIPALRMLLPPLPVGAAPERMIQILPHVDVSELSAEAALQVSTQNSGSWVLPENMFGIVLILWLGTAALLFLVQLVKYNLMRDAMFADADIIGEQEGVTLITSGRIESPFAFGIWRRYVALPQDFAVRYSNDEQTLALAHELSHHRAYDLHANMVGFMLLCLNWFNPLSWISWNAFRLDQEAACDARIVAGKSAGTRHCYGKILARSANGGMPVLATALNTHKTIFERLRRLSMPETTTQRKTLGKWAVIAAAALILPLTATITPAAEPDTVAAAAEPKRERVKVIKIVKNKDGKTVDVIGDEAQNVTKIERDGKTFVFHTDKKLSDDEVEKMVKDADSSLAMADMNVADSSDGSTKKKKMIIRVHKNDKDGIQTVSDGSEEMSADHAAIASGKCPNGEAKIINVENGSEGHKSRIKMVFCGDGDAKLQREAAMKGLTEARTRIAKDSEMSENIRKEVVDNLNAEIKKLEAEIASGS